MHRIKSIFISLSLIIWSIYSYLLIIKIIEYNVLYIILGLSLISILPLGFFIILLIFRPVARTSSSLLIFNFLALAGTAFILLGAYQQLIASYFIYISITSNILWFGYVFWYSKMPQAINNLEVGKQLPNLTFIDNEKNTFFSSNYLGKKVLYIFYRGNWCPLCMAQIKEISSQYNELTKRGVEVLLISPQPVSHSARLAKRMKVKFHFLTDINNKMARKLKIDQAYGVPFGIELFGYTSETVLPTVIITDEKGKIIFYDQTNNYRVKPEPSTFLAVLDKVD